MSEHCVHLPLFLCRRLWCAGGRRARRVVVGGQREEGKGLQKKRRKDFVALRLKCPWWRTPVFLTHARDVRQHTSNSVSNTADDTTKCNWSPQTMEGGERRESSNESVLPEIISQCLIVVSLESHKLPILLHRIEWMDVRNWMNGSERNETDPTVLKKRVTYGSIYLWPRI